MQKTVIRLRLSPYTMLCACGNFQFPHSLFVSVCLFNLVSIRKHVWEKDMNVYACQWMYELALVRICV